MWQGVKFHFKTANRKTDHKGLHKKPKLEACLKGGKISGRAPKKTQIK